MLIKQYFTYFPYCNRIFIFAFIAIILTVPTCLSAQSDTIRYESELSGLVSTGKYSPFWLQSNRYGKISPSPISALLSGNIYKEFENSEKLIDYGFKISTLLQTDKSVTKLYFHEFYAKARLSVYSMTVGSRERIFGNQDSTLSCGGFLFSKNARPMPEISIDIERFTPVPLTHGFLEIKGGLRHGVFSDNISIRGALLHHKYLYARIGGKLPVHFQYGIDHAAQWGGTNPVYGAYPNGFKNYLRIFMAKSGSNDANESDRINVLGNHIISQSMKVELDISGIKLSGYWQNLSEDGPVKFITGNPMNMPDGLWGISVKSNKYPFVKGLLYELLNTTDQSGPYHDKDGLIYGGRDNYFLNGSYQSGWSFYSHTIGTPFISSPLYNTIGILCTINNRVHVHHFGIEGNVSGFEYKALASFSRNYGTYSKPLDIRNTSVLLEINKQVSWLSGLELSCSAGGDFGKLYGNSLGVMFSVRKRGILFGY